MAYATNKPYTNEVLKALPDATDAEVDAMPFRDLHPSGYGRELGAAGIREFVNQKVINGARVAQSAA